MDRDYEFNLWVVPLTKGGDSGPHRDLHLFGPKFTGETVSDLFSSSGDTKVVVSVSGTFRERVKMFSDLK